MTAGHAIVAGTAARAGGAGRGGVATLVDLGTLVASGWDPEALVWTPDPSDLVFGFRCCAVRGCRYQPDNAEGLCAGCKVAWMARGAGDLAEYCVAGVQHHQWCAEVLCLVCNTAGHERPAIGTGLCIACGSLCSWRGQSVDAYVNGDDGHGPAVPRPSFGVCAVRSCDRRAQNRVSLCGPHSKRWARDDRPALADWCVIAPPAKGDRAGHVVLRGLSPAVITEVLFGLQAALVEGRKTPPVSIGLGVEWLRRTQASSVLDVDPGEVSCGAARLFLAFTADRLRVASSSPELEYDRDVWDLRVWGHEGRLSFTGGLGPRRRRSSPVDGRGGEYRRRARPVIQPWLRAAAKAWAFQALVSIGAGRVRQIVWMVGLWSEHLATRVDRGTSPEALTSEDLFAFLARLRQLENRGELAAMRRSRGVEDLARFLRDCRDLGLTQPGGPMFGLADEIMIRRADKPRRPKVGDDSETGLALPDSVVMQLLDDKNLARAQERFGPGLRRAIELLAGVGRRPDEVASLTYECLDHDETVDADGTVRYEPVLVHNMAKVGKLGCRLPIHQRERDLIIAQQTQVRIDYPDTPTSELCLFPRTRKNPAGIAPISAPWLSRAMRLWVDALPALDLTAADGRAPAVAFPRDRVFPYAFRHTFAQRHADAGTAPDVLKELMGHDAITATMGYYRITTKRKRQAQDRLGPLQIDAGGNRVRDERPLSDSEAIRDSIGQVAVPFGVCTEPVNVRADGQACPFRHRCLGCVYFRTDPSYQPELRAYLTRLLADRERLHAALPQLADWARRDAVPSSEEIETLRQLMDANDGLIAHLDDTERAAVSEAITELRKHRAGLERSYPVQFRGLVRPENPNVFPSIERHREEPGDD